MSDLMQGAFQITSWDESPCVSNNDATKNPDPENSDSENTKKLARATVTQLYTGAIEGNSSTEYIMSYLKPDFAMFTGYEKLNITIEGKTGSIILKHDGKFQNGIAISEFSVVQGSGIDELANLYFSGSFKSGEAGRANYLISLG